MAQIHPAPAYDHRLAERAIDYLQTRDPRLFPFTAHFTPEQQRAFVRDLREGLADLQDSGSARKTSSTGQIMNDRHLRQVVRDWALANGDWPIGSEPYQPATSLGAAPGKDEGTVAPPPKSSVAGRS